MPAPKDIQSKLDTLGTAWDLHAKDKSFGGMTLEEFKAAIQPSLDSRDRLNGLTQKTADEINVRDGADEVSLAKAELVVNGVVGDPAFGPDSSLYEAMGYVRKSERHSGLTRKKKVAAAVAAK